MLTLQAMRSVRARVLLADDHLLVREGLRTLLGAQPDLEVVGETGDGAEAVRLAGELSPDVVVMDLSLKGMSGIEATRRVRRAHPHVEVVVLSMHEDPATVDRALSAGARGYVLKGRGIDSLCEAIRGARRGEVYLSPDLSDYVLRGYLGRTGYVPPPLEEASPIDPLSEREREVLSLLAEGLSGPRIAERLGLRPKTVENHRARIMDKLGIHTTAGLVRWALRSGLCE
jgi:DNA-binding NarL/FixJ family response regulator